MRKEKGVEDLDARKLHKGLHWKGKKKTTRARLAKKTGWRALGSYNGSGNGAIMAVENGCPYVVLSKLLCLAPFFLNFTLSF